MFVIRRMLHRVWLGPQPISDHAWQCEETWRKSNSEWKPVWWGDEHAEPAFSILARHTSGQSPDLAAALSTSYEQASRPEQRSDILRLVMLFLYGGVAIDPEVESHFPLEPRLEPWLEAHAAFVSSCPGSDAGLTLRGLAPASEAMLIGATRQNPFIGFCLQNLLPWFQGRQGADAEAPTPTRAGSLFIREMLCAWNGREHSQDDAQVALLPDGFLLRPPHQDAGHPPDLPSQELMPSLW